MPFTWSDGPLKKAAYPFPSEPLRAKLFEIYSSRVDSVYRISHWPATSALICSQRQLLQQDPAVQALEYAIYFMALCATTDAESEIMMLRSKEELQKEYRAAAETLLVQANIVSMPGSTVLHAFVIYLVSSLRPCSFAPSTTQILNYVLADHNASSHYERV